MAINQKRMAAALSEANKVLNSRIRNSRKARRVRNEDDMQVDLSDLGLDEGAAEGDEGGEDEGEPEGETVEVMIDPENIEDRIMTALEDAFDEPVEAVEVVDDGGDDEEGDEEDEEGETEQVENSCRGRSCRNARNARIVRNADGSRSVVIPLGGKTKRNVKNARRVVRNADLAGMEVAEGQYATTMTKTPSISSLAAKIENARRRKLASLINKANKYDAMQVRASVKNALSGVVTNAIDEVLEKAVQEAVDKKLGNTLNSRTSRKVTKNAKGGIRRYKNYRLVRNEDGGIEVEIAVAPEGGVTVDVDTPAVDIAPATDIIPTADVTVDGEPVTEDEMDMIKNYRQLRKIRNARSHSRSAVVRNESTTQTGNGSSVAHESEVQSQETSVMNAEFGGPLEVPSTFPTNL